MRVAAIYDIHGNLPALEGVLADIGAEGLELVIVGGVRANAGCGPRSFDWTRCARADDSRQRRPPHRQVVRRGSAVEDVADAEDRWLRRAAWEGEQFSKAQRDFLAALPDTVTLEIDGLGTTLFCHGSPRSDEEIITPGTTEERLDEILAAVDADVVVCGHTHMQFDRRHGRTRVVNAGSVGLPYEGRAGASWAQLGPDVSLRCTDYDFEASAEAVCQSGYPEAEQHVVALFLEQPGRDEVTKFFEEAAERAWTQATSEQAQSSD
jgi:diadenosine tetraphosphatase ApaH/serine/threonine PP2A family protein phosphatase